MKEKTMNIDEIPAGRQTDALVWLALEGRALELMLCRFVDGDVQPHAGYPIGHISPPHYSTDYNDAFGLVREMRDRGFWWSSSYKEPCLTDNKWQAAYSVTFRCVDGKNGGVHIATALELPLAICRAALKVAMKGEANELGR